MGKRKAEEEEEAFPRSRPKADDATADAPRGPRGGPRGKPGGSDDEAPFRVDGEDNKTRKKKARDDAPDDDEEEELDPDTASVGPSFAKVSTKGHRLRPVDLTQGTLLVAAVREVYDEELILSLPYNITGAVSRAQATEAAFAEQIESLDELYRVGQLVLAVVTTVTELKEGSERTSFRVECSLRPSLANAGLEPADVVPHMWLPAVVDGEEEHVFKLAFGVANFKGLLMKKQVESMPSAPKPGAVVFVAVQAVNGSTLRCSAAAAQAMGDVPLKLEALKAGYIVRARVQRLMPVAASSAGQDNGGALLRFCGSLLGVAHVHHQPALSSGKSQENKLARGQWVTARILAVVPGSPSLVHLTLVPHLLDWKPMSRTSITAAIGDRVDAEVLDFSPGYGSILRYAAKDATMTAFCPGTKMTDKDVDASKQALNPGDQIVCRVLGHNYLDGTAIVTRRPYDLRDDTIVSVTELSAGQIVVGPIARIMDFGVFVQLSEYVQGLVPLRHLTDVPLATVPKKYQLGSKLKCRVLNVREDRRHLTLTAKKSMVKDDFQLTNFAQVRRDMLVNGYVQKVADYGAIIAFYGNMFALMPAPEMESDEAPALGMAVRCRVASVSKKKQRFALSLDLTNGKAPSEFFDDKGAPMPSDSAPQPGDEATEVHAIQSIPLGLVVSFKCKRTADQQRSAYILWQHLSDSLEQAKARHAAIAADLDKKGKGSTKGVSLGEGVVLAIKYSPKEEEVEAVENRESTMFSLLSLKPSMTLAATEGAFMVDTASVQEGKLYTGYVKDSFDQGVFVSLGAWRCSGLAPKFRLASHFVEKISDEFKHGQTVRALVARVDEEKGRFQLDLRPVAPSPPDSAEAVLRREAVALQRYFEWQAALASVDGKQCASLLPGAVVEARVETWQAHGAVLSLPEHEGLTAVALKENVPEANRPKEGDVVRCAVLDFDVGNKSVDVSLQPQLLKADGDMLSALKAKSEGISQPGKKKRKGKEKANTKQETNGKEEVKGVEGDTVDAVPAPAGTIPVTVLAALHKPAYSVLWCKDPPAVLFAPPMGQQRWSGPRQAVLHFVPEAPGLFSRVIGWCPIEEASAEARTRLPRILDPQQELKVGSPITLRVVSKKAFHVNVKAPVGIRGIIHATQFVDSSALGVNGGKPMDTVAKQGVIEARVLGIKEHVENKQGQKTWLLNLTCRPSLLKSQDAAVYEDAVPKWRKLKVGQQMPAAVWKIHKKFMWVEVAPDIRGRIALLDLSKDRAVVNKPQEYFQVGQIVEAKVLRVAATSKTLDMTLIGEGVKAPPSSGLSLGRLEVLKEPPDRGIAAYFRLPGKRKGAVHITEVFDFWAQAPLKRLRQGTMHELLVLEPSRKKSNLADCGEGTVALSLRGSKVHGQKEGKEEQRPARIADLAVGQKINGYVVNSGPKGVFVGLSRTVTAQIKLRNLGEMPTQKDAVSRLFPVGAFIRDAIVVFLDESKNHLELSLRKGDVDGLKFEQLSVGDVVSGHVKNIQAYGIFVKIENSLMTGLVGKDDVSDTASVSLDSFERGMLLKRLKVTKIDPEKKQVWLGIKASLFDGDEGADDEEDEDDEEEDLAEEAAEPEAAEKASPAAVQAKAEPAAVVAKDSDDEEVPWAQASAANTIGAGAAFQWADFSAGHISASEDEAQDDGAEDADAEEKRPTKRQKKAAVHEEVQELARREAENADGRWASDPRSIDDFERLLLTEGSTSIVWIRYMAFHLKLSDLEKARQVAERAVKHVGFAESRERFNVWVAFMNLECTFGTEETAEAVFKRASAHNDAKQVHMQLCRIHERNKKIPLAVKAHETCCRKFPQSQKVWLALLTFLYGQGDLEGARKKLPNALAAVPRRKHPLVVSQAALLEYNHGSPERGRSIFEGLLDSYPKRTDLWSVYLDAHIKAYTPPKVATADLTEVRSILERCCAMKLKVTKMRFFFKRWLDFEKRWGDIESQEKVRARARDFVEQQAS